MHSASARMVHAGSGLESGDRLSEASARVSGIPARELAARCEQACFSYERAARQ